MVNDARRMLSAISFECALLAPSTRAIVRAMKVSPGLAVMRILSQSLTMRGSSCYARSQYRCPRVLLITGADSPVMAASFTEPTPSMTSPITGDAGHPLRPGLRHHRRNSVAETTRDGQPFF